jgi:hypothetical protein
MLRIGVATVQVAANVALTSAVATTSSFRNNGGDVYARIARGAEADRAPACRRQVASSATA